ncbi:MAG TPA: protein kinase, partial [Byssovorax sp.]
MRNRCESCGNDFDVRRFCPACGAAQSRPIEDDDPFVGRVVEGRFEVVERIRSGGMGVVYKARQRPLERDVAIKFVHPHLLDTPGITARFLVEARAASRLNHPHVVSIFDFGETTIASARTFYLVMELLSGRDLAVELGRGAELPHPRIARIFEQALAGLGEAHANGVMHRDIKPDNILLEQTRGGLDHVKIIDFGIAKLLDRAAVTQPGRVVGTPRYMPPEQLEGAPAEPSFDLWALGVVLFSALTGRVPFDDRGPKPGLFTPPDPREFAPRRNISPALADVCMAALHPDRARRYPDAESFADAIVRAATPRARADRSIFPPRSVRPPSTEVVMPRRIASRAELATTAPPPSLGGPFLGREADVAWARGALADTGRAGGYMWGRSGLGKTRLLEAVATAERQDGALVVTIAGDAPPGDEVGFGGLRAALLALTSIASDAALLEVAEEAGPRIGSGVAAIFSEDSSEAGEKSTREAALGWAARTAVARGRGKCLLFIDDFDRLDRSSRRALGALFASDATPGLRVLVTASAPGGAKLAGALRERRLTGLNAAAQKALFPKELRLRTPARDEIEPLYVSLAVSLASELDGPLPDQLPELFVAAASLLTPSERRLAQALALVGAAPPDAVAEIADVEAADAAIARLVDVGLARLRGQLVEVAHAGFGGVVLAGIPVGALATYHARAAAALVEAPRERAAFHALRGEVDLAGFLLGEQAARLRIARGDTAGAMDILGTAVAAARALVARSDPDAPGWLAIFAEKLGGLMLANGRGPEGAALLREVAESIDLDHKARALALGHLA